MAVPELNRLKFFVSLAFPGDTRALAVEATLGVKADEGLARTGSRAG